MTILVASISEIIIPSISDMLIFSISGSIIDTNSDNIVAIFLKDISWHILSRRETPYVSG